MSSPLSGKSAAYDKQEGACRASDKTPSLPSQARLPINRCNLPAVILGGLTYQEHPVPLYLDGVEELHRELFRHLDGLDEAAERAQLFRDYMSAHFCLDNLEDAGYEGHGRAKANWLRLLRGWSFDSDGLEGAALKGWVESRFGLPPRFHGEPLRQYGSDSWHRYEEMRARAIYGTNALEAQLDVLYAYCQYEVRRQDTPEHVTLYRGVNGFHDHELLYADERGQVVLFNNLMSFSSSRDRAGEFGDTVLEAKVPASKVFFHCRLLPGVLKGEDEYLVIGGVYRVRRDGL